MNAPLTFSFTCKWTVPGKVPRSFEATSGYCWISCSAFSLLLMSSLFFLSGGQTGTKACVCTVISPIYWAGRAPVRGLKLSKTTSNSTEYFFLVFGFLISKRHEVPRGFTSVPFHIFNDLVDDVTLLPAWNLKIMFIVAPQPIILLSCRWFASLCISLSQNRMLGRLPKLALK